jgi:hypothetical protein
MKFLGDRIANPNILRLIARFLKAGVLEDGIRYDTPEGTPQGGVVSPILGNIYLHYALDLWFHLVVRKSCKGKAFMVRYADDFVCCFQFEEDARAFYRALVPRPGEILELLSCQRTIRLTALAIPAMRQSFKTTGTA